MAAVAIAALAGLVGWLLVRRRNRTRAWWQGVDRIVRDADALLDVGSSGPAGTDPEQQVAHWSMLEQRADALQSKVAATSAEASSDDAGIALVALSEAAMGYRGSVRTIRQLHVGPPAPTPEQLEFAEAENGQQLNRVRTAIDQLRRLTDRALGRALSA